MKTYEELQAENAALMAQVEVIKQDLAQLYPHIKSADRKLCFSLGEALQLIEKSLKSLPQQCLHEIQAEAVEEALDATYNEIRNRIGKDYSNIVESIILEYAAKIRRGGE